MYLSSPFLLLLLLFLRSTESIEMNGKCLSDWFDHWSFEKDSSSPLTFRFERGAAVTLIDDLKSVRGEEEEEEEKCSSTRTRSVPFASINELMFFVRSSFLSTTCFFAAWLTQIRHRWKNNTDSIDRLRARNRKGLNDVVFVLSLLQQIEQRFEDDFKATNESVVTDTSSGVKFDSKRITRL